VSELLLLIEGQMAGRVVAEHSGRLTLTYEPGWLKSNQAHSLSVSMQLGTLTYPHKLVSPYLWNLLPENPNVLQRWAQQHHVSAANPFKLLTFVGADVPGAAQFLPPEQSDAIEAEHAPRIDWIDMANLQERLRQLREDISAMRRPGDIGKLSLPGAQAKTAFYWDVANDRWGIPGGRTPTTHIIKPCVPGFDGLVENEHLCQDIAARLHLVAAKSSVLSLDDTYIVVERYDRLPPSADAPIPRRIHQEDLCQALGLMPAYKYQEDGGPGIAQIAALLRRVSTEPEIDVHRFLQANIFNWLIGGTDAHAKNYSLLIGAADEVRLAPLYDLSSQLPYPDLITQKVAMKIGAHYQIARVGVEDWHHVAKTCNLAQEQVIAMVTSMAKALPDEIAAARDQALKDGLSRSAIIPLAQNLIAHAQERLASLIPITSRSHRLRKRARPT
jgi:serine/threonine-protein kinase HipA